MHRMDRAKLTWPGPSGHNASSGQNGPDHLLFDREKKNCHFPHFPVTKNGSQIQSQIGKAKSLLSNLNIHAQSYLHVISQKA